ncbi:EthD domain-containing protein [Streptomyces sp. NPDC004237]|uniref:EthD domain-containing protein n=1 Tax=Streptomyces sp. NPDC004237 TaxID=3154455 RepID=UPI0033B4645A
MISKHPKSIYLALRNPALDHDSFMARWRHHGSLGRAKPGYADNVVRYEQCDVNQEISAPTCSRDYDGVGIVTYRTVEARRAHHSNPSSEVLMAQDGAATFGVPVEETRTFCYEVTILSGMREGTKVFRFVWREPAADHTSFVAAWAASLSLNARTLRDVAPACVLNVPLNEPGASAGLGCDLVEEYLCPDLAAASRLVERLSPAPDGLAVDRSVTVITDSVCLYDGSDRNSTA